MLETEFIKSLQCNYERLKLEEKPEEMRYQYCIACRGGITGLLPMSLRYINGDAFLYYDISSKQALSQIYRKKNLDRKWLLEFIWNLRRIRLEMRRFLLDEKNLIWYPEKIYQSLGETVFSFLYVPYYEGDNGFRKLLDFMVERADYEDEGLIGVIYRIYEQYDQAGDVYLQEQIYEDVKVLEKEEPVPEAKPGTIRTAGTYAKKEDISKDFPEDLWEDLEDAAVKAAEGERPAGEEETFPKERKGLLAFLDSSRRKNRDARERYQEANLMLAEGMAVAETAAYEEEEEEPESRAEVQTVYMETVAERKDAIRRIFDESGKVLCILREDSLVIGKRSGDADVSVSDPSVSRMHARVEYVEGNYYLEDLNSTNGTFKNGIRLAPYEKKQLHSEDELRLGATVLYFR
ncbi:MAG: FHA domain-containing protein [Lachnospiraceae bacterium]|nr:FHA domain-containing protein [Lachnospiraceae bacterium]